MDTEEIFLYSRIKSTRSKTRNRKEYLEKKLIALDKERKNVRFQIRNLGYAPLIPPVQKGWKRIFVVRDDVRRGRKGAFFETLLEKINTVQYSDSKKFLTRRRKRGRKIYINREQKLKDLCEWEWYRLRLTNEEKTYFTEIYVMDSRMVLYKRYIFNEPWRYVLKVVPNMIALLQIKDAVLEQRLGEIGNYLLKNNLEGKLGRLRGHKMSYWKEDPKERYKNPLQNKPLHEILQEYYE